jgi:membrane protein implicated in regulation of membrane protease activity
MPGFTWPPRDTDRNRFLCRLQVVLYGLVTAYFGLFALVSGALVPWTIFTVALAATLVVVVAIVLMRAQRQAAEQPTQQSPRQSPQQSPRRP